MDRKKNDGGPHRRSVHRVVSHVPGSGAVWRWIRKIAPAPVGTRGDCKTARRIYTAGTTRRRGRSDPANRVIYDGAPRARRYPPPPPPPVRLLFRIVFIHRPTVPLANVKELDFPRAGGGVRPKLITTVRPTAGNRYLSRPPGGSASAAPPSPIDRLNEPTRIGYPNPARAPQTSLSSARFFSPLRITKTTGFPGHIYALYVYVQRPRPS